MLRFIFLYILFFPIVLVAQNKTVPYDHVLTDQELIELLDIDYSSSLTEIKLLYNKGEEEKALEELAEYFKEKFSERYFFDWKNFTDRFIEYNKMYSGRYEFHYQNARNHLELYPSEVSWKLPFKNLEQEDVTAYAYRHLGRQHKAGDIAILYFYTKDKKYINYIPEQAESLNKAFNLGLVETIKDGNGAYEVYRAGNRMYNWLFAHQVLLATTEYSWQQQLEMIRTFLHTGAQLSYYNPAYKEGNHQTRGMSSLALLSFLFPEIEGTQNWKNQSLKLLEEHLQKEIYPDGFQFERSVHYHIADIENYFYPFVLAEINQIELNPIWEDRLKGLFDVLVAIATPDNNAPVLQDDTDSPWAEFNRIDEAMALGTILFAKPEYNYFASSKVPSSYYWFLKQDQLHRLSSVTKTKPKIGSCDLPESGYYIMRQGWDKDDLYMVISAGLSAEKPDHQHGDMLGLQAYAYGNMILPNYQVRYYLPDLAEFKNSWLKNVLLVDSIPQGRKWTGNQGGSGFGKWGVLPQPEVLAWKTTDEFDFFAGSHNGYDDSGVKYFRSVVFIKDGFWIVRDHLISGNADHKAQQVWQGHYDVEQANKHIRSVFPDGAGLEIIQLGEAVKNISKASIRGKGRTVFEKDIHSNSGFTTLLYPFEDFEERLEIDAWNDFQLAGWQFFTGENSTDNIVTDARQIIQKNENYLFFDVLKLNIDGHNISVSNRISDLWVKVEKNIFSITNIGVEISELNYKGKLTNIKPGETKVIYL